MRATATRKRYTEIPKLFEKVVDTLDKMKAALSAGSAAARRSEFVVYPGTPHAFHADYRPNYHKQAAEDGWKRCLAWFADHGVV